MIYIFIPPLIKNQSHVNPCPALQICLKHLKYPGSQNIIKDNNIVHSFLNYLLVGEKIVFC